MYYYCKGIAFRLHLSDLTACGCDGVRKETVVMLCLAVCAVLCSAYRRDEAETVYVQVVIELHQLCWQVDAGLLLILYLNTQSH